MSTIQRAAALQRTLVVTIAVVGSAGAIPLDEAVAHKERIHQHVSEPPNVSSVAFVIDGLPAGNTSTRRTLKLCWRRIGAQLMSTRRTTLRHLHQNPAVGAHERANRVFPTDPPESLQTMHRVCRITCATRKDKTIYDRGLCLNLENEPPPLGSDWRRRRHARCVSVSSHCWWPE